MVNWSAYPGDPDPGPEPHPKSIEVGELLEAADVDQDLIDKVVAIIDELGRAADADCPRCESRGIEEQIQFDRLARFNPGMRIDAENLVRRSRKPTEIRWLFNDMLKNLREVRDRTRKGDLTAIEEFYILYAIDDAKPASWSSEEGQ